MIKPYALRLLLGQDPKAVLDAFAQDHKIAAACMLTCVGSLRKAVLRFANQEQMVSLIEISRSYPYRGIFRTWRALSHRHSGWKMPHLCTTGKLCAMRRFRCFFSKARCWINMDRSGRRLPGWDRRLVTCQRR